MKLSLTSKRVRIRGIRRRIGKQIVDNAARAVSCTYSTISAKDASADTTTSPETRASVERDGDILTNDGVVQGVWMFCRHGDRVPGRCLSPAHRQDEESAFWMTKLPSPDSQAAFEAFSKRYPLQVPNNSINHGMFLDVRRNPYGFLTQNGLQQLKENGTKFYNRYSKYAHHQPDRLVWHRDTAANDFLDAFHVTVYSTNYLRTVLSVQSFLDGLLGTNCYVPATVRQYDPKVVKEARIPTHTCGRGKENDALVRVRVRDLSNDPLNAFDRSPDLVAEMVSEVMLSKDFLKHDAGAAPLAARLANVLPGLVRPFRTDFSKKSPSGINWVEASDHFVCRKAHGLGYAQFSDFEDDDRVEQTLAAMAHQTLAHLSWRFRQWYQHKRLLSVIAAPPLREVADQIAATPALHNDDKRPFVVYSCHDITILGLLYGIGAEFLADDNNSQWRFWPTYGSHLVFELVKMKDESHVIRVLLNGKPVISVDHNWKGNSIMYRGIGPKNMLVIDDFVKVVEALEEHSSEIF